MDVKSKEGNEYRNNLTIYVAKGNNGLENCVNGHLVSNHNYTLVINGNLSIRQMIDVCEIIIIIIIISFHFISFDG